MQEIMYYLLFSSYKNHFLVQIYVDLFIPKRKSGQVFHACVLGMLIRLIKGERHKTIVWYYCPLTWTRFCCYCSGILLLPCISWPRVVSWPPSSYFEISINLKACIILEWSIIIRFIITTTFKTCADTRTFVCLIHLNEWRPTYDPRPTYAGKQYQ